MPMTIRKSYLVEKCKDWGGADVGLSTRQALEMIGEEGAEVEYDCIGHRCRSQV